MICGNTRIAWLALMAAAVLCGQRPEWVQLRSGGDLEPVAGHALAFHPPSRRLISFGGSQPGVETIPYRLVFAEWHIDRERPLVWKALDAVGDRPAGRVFCAATYDPERDRLLIFGGATDRRLKDLLNDAYVLEHASGTTGTPRWVKLTPEGDTPLPRAVVQGVLVNDGRDLLVFGGCSRGRYGCDVSQNDLWQLSGLLGSTPSWQRLATAGESPGGRHSHSLALVTDRNQILLFGGSPAGRPPWNDTWVLENFGLRGDPAWKELTVEGQPPTGRYNHAAVWVPAADALFVFGGTRVSHVTNDTWLLQMADDPPVFRWEEIDTVGVAPPPRENLPAVFDPDTSRILITGGVRTGQFFSDTWVLELEPYLHRSKP